MEEASGTNNGYGGIDIALKEERLRLEVYGGMRRECILEKIEHTPHDLLGWLEYRTSILKVPYRGNVLTNLGQLSQEYLSLLQGDVSSKTYSAEWFDLPAFKEPSIRATEQLDIETPLDLWLLSGNFLHANAMYDEDQNFLLSRDPPKINTLKNEGRKSSLEIH